MEHLYELWAETASGSAPATASAGSLLNPLLTALKEEAAEVAGPVPVRLLRALSKNLYEQTSSKLGGNSAHLGCQAPVHPDDPFFQAAEFSVRQHELVAQHGTVSHNCAT